MLIRNLSLSVGLFAATTFTGCVAPKASQTTEQSLHKYKRVYVARANPDPRDVFPRMVKRFENMGLEVREPGAGGSSQGTGFVVSTNSVLTCAHVLGTNTAATLWIQRQRFEADVVRSDTNIDLALLKLRSASTNSRLIPLRFSADELKLGQPVFTMGFPLTEILGKTPRLNQGVLSSSVGFEDNPQQYQISTQVQPGNSGGPLLTANGEVVGVITATLNPLRVLATTGGNLPQNVNFASKASVAAEFLRTNAIANEPAAAQTNAFEVVQQSLALVRAGIIPPGEEDAPELVCEYSYVSFWDLWFRFRVFHVVLRDAKSSEVLVKAGQYRDNPFTTEDAVMDRTFEELKRAFHGTPTVQPPR